MLVLRDNSNIESRNLKQKELTTMCNTRYFVCDDGIIWSLYSNGESNFPHTIKVEEAGTAVNPSTGEALTYSQVLWLGSSDDNESRPIEGEFVLHNSLMELALEIEKPHSDDSSVVTLDEVVHQGIQQVLSFKHSYIMGNKTNPDHYPLTQPVSNSGVWFEQMFDE